MFCVVFCRSLCSLLSLLLWPLCCPYFNLRVLISPVVSSNTLYVNYAFLFTLFVFFCIYWCPTHIVLCFLFCLSSSCVWCIVVSNTYCVVCFFCLRLVSCGVQHVLCCVFCFVLCDQCFASFSGLSIRDSPLGFSNVYLVGYLNWRTARLMTSLLYTGEQK